MKKFSWRWIIAIILVVSICCLAALAAYAIYLFIKPDGQTSGPVIFFDMPASGEHFPAGQMVQVHVIARDPEKVARMELWIDGALIDNEKSPLKDGVSPLVLAAGWTPSESGQQTLTARAYDSQGEESTGETTVTVEDPATSLAPDRDADRFPDDVDACPDEPGIEPVGCPLDIADADNDGTEDSLDECPDTPGSMLTEGCPDGDGDGVADEYDSCLDAAGAGDSPAGPGCPSAASDDRDGDGVIDGEDACPDVPGAVDVDGCPGESFALPGDSGDAAAADLIDSDGDGMADNEDICPGEAGSAEDGGCPADAADSDGDGFPDNVDLCPDIAGEAPDGCAVPGAVAEEDGIRGFGFPFPGTTALEFQALTFTVNEDYDEVNCYASLSTDPPDLYGPFHFEGERTWNITDYMGSISVAAADGEPLPVFVSCFGYSGPAGAPEFHYIGQYTARHNEGDWDGHVITAVVNELDSPAGSAIPDTEGFTATYRICEGSCEDTPLPAPVLTFAQVFGVPMLAWNFNGDEAVLENFKLYVNGTYAALIDGDDRFLPVSRYQPACGGQTVFQLTAAGGGEESPLSNQALWRADECDSRRVRVTFNRLVTHGGSSDDTYGPIFGNFRAAGSTEARLVFDGDDYPHGYGIPTSGTTTVMSLFNTINASSIHSMCAGSRCLDVSAPEVNYVEVEVEPEGSLSVGVSLYDENPMRIVTLIDMDISIPFEDIAPGRFNMRMGQVELVYFIDFVPEEEDTEAGAAERLPDLRITELEAAEGDQTRAWVVNMGGTMADQPVRIEYYDREDETLLYGMTYEALTLANGEGRWLQSDRPVPMHGVIAIIDPDEQVEESNESNNRYTAPVLLQVSLEKIFINTFCEFFLMRYSEFFYSYSVGYGPDEGHITWNTYHLRYPLAGYVRYDRFDNDEGLYVYPSAEEIDYNVHVAVPAGNNLYIAMAGTEYDGGALDDSMGSIFVTIPEADYLTADQAVSRHHSQGASNDTCHDAEPLQGGWLGFDAWFMVHRLE